MMPWSFGTTCGGGASPSAVACACMLLLLLLLTWCIHGARPRLLPQSDVDLPQLLVQPLNLALPLPGRNTTHKSTDESDELGDTHDVNAERRGTQLAILGGPALFHQLLACLLKLPANLALLLQAQLVQLALLLCEDAPESTQSTLLVPGCQ